MASSFKKLFSYLTNNRKTEEHTPAKNADTFTKISKVFRQVVLILVRPLIIAPLFIILHQHLPNPDWIWNLDRILLLLMLIALIEVVIYYLQPVIYFLSFGFLIFLTYGSLWKGIGYKQFLEEYKIMMYNMKNSPAPERVLMSEFFPNISSEKYITAVDYDNPSVRNFAVAMATKNFKNMRYDLKYLPTIQSFSVFKEINSRWTYVYDPLGKDYIAKASESLKHFSGDCDDYAILIAACSKAIGGKVRLIHAENHMYPELNIGTHKDLEVINFLIRKNLFVTESKNGDIHYHTDSDGQVWINMDYTANYPGGRFLSQKIIAIINLY